VPLLTRLQHIQMTHYHRQKKRFFFFLPFLFSFDLPRTEQFTNFVLIHSDKNSRRFFCLCHPSAFCFLFSASASNCSDLIWNQTRINRNQAKNKGRVHESESQKQLEEWRTQEIIVIKPLSPQSSPRSNLSVLSTFHFFSSSRIFILSLNVREAKVQGARLMGSTALLWCRRMRLWNVYFWMDASSFVRQSKS